MNLWLFCANRKSQTFFIRLISDHALIGRILMIIELPFLSGLSFPLRSLFGPLDFHLKFASGCLRGSPLLQGCHISG